MLPNNDSPKLMCLAYPDPYILLLVLGHTGRAKVYNRTLLADEAYVGLWDQLVTYVAVGIDFGVYCAGGLLVVEVLEHLARV